MKRTRMRRKPSRDRAVWIRARDAKLRQTPECEVPGRPEHIGAIFVHHIENRGMGYRDHSQSNLMTLCWNHHVGRDGVHSMGRDTWRKRFWGEA